VDARLLEIVQLARDGWRESALLRLRTYLQAHPQDADAWMVLGGLAPDRKIALSALRRAVQLAPDHALAREALATLEAQVAAPSASSSPSESPASEYEPQEFHAPTVSPEAVAPETEPPMPADVSFEEPPIASLAGPEFPSRSDEAEEVPVPEKAGPPGYPGEANSHTLRDARAVLWPFVARGEKPRAIGALLDENRLTRQDLLWAVQEAHNEEVRQAAQRLLESPHRMADVAMTLEDARLIAWPFRRLNRPLGKLVASGTVQVKDLRRAAWYAKDARLREAARVMLPVAMERREAEKRRRAAQKERQQATEQAQSASPPPTAPALPSAQAAKPERVRPHDHDSEPPKNGRIASAEAMTRPMTIIQGSDYLTQEVQRRYRKSVFVAAVALVLVLAGLCVILAIMAIEFVNRKTPALWLWPLVAVLLLPLFWLSDRFVEVRQEEQNFRRGQLGESEVARLLRLGLGGDWTLFRNVKLPGSKVDIDMVLLGPPGVFALEVKAYTGGYRYVKQHFYRRTMMAWHRMQHNPGRQARAAAGLLHAYITETLNESVWVEPRLVWVGPGQLELEEPEVYVWFLEKLGQETERLRALPPRLSAEKRAAISGLLRGLCSTLR